MIVSKYVIWFVLFSFMGWIYESIFCTIKNHHWSNRGFLFGPICPIYGFGAVAAAIVCAGGNAPEMENWKIFIICFLGSIVLEYVTSWVLEKLFHAIWWDYSRVPFNIHGRVCLPASIGFGVAGLLVVHFLLPFAQRVTGHLSLQGMEVLALLLMAILAADTALTVSALTSLMQNIQTVEDAVNKQMEDFYANLEGSLIEKRQQALERKDEFTATAAEKREEFTRSAVETMNKMLNRGEKHALHSVKEFHYGEHTSKFSNMLLKVEREVRERAGAVKEATTEKMEAVKEATTEKMEAVKEATTEKMEAVKEVTTEKMEAVKEATTGKVESVKEATMEKVEAIKEATKEAANGKKKSVQGEDEKDMAMEKEENEQV